MSRVYYCPSCGTIKPYNRAPGGKPCCPDDYNVLTDIDVARQAEIGFKVENVLAEVARRIGMPDDWKRASDILRAFPTDIIVDEIMVGRWGELL